MRKERDNNSIEIYNNRYRVAHTDFVDCRRRRIFLSNMITMALDSHRYDLIRSGHSNYELIDKKGETIDVFRRGSSQPGYTTCTRA
jgi:hypothetical protein